MDAVLSPLRLVHLQERRVGTSVVRYGFADLTVPELAHDHGVMAGPSCRNTGPWLTASESDYGGPWSGAVSLSPYKRAVNTGVGPLAGTACNRVYGMKRAIDVAPFGELADPRVLAELAAAAEDRGWAGFFVWDHVVYRAPVRAVADPWVTLAAVACATSTLRVGPMVTPLSRRRVHKVARETVTLDILSSGRLTLGVGLGSARNGELEPFGKVADPRERARLLDMGLADLARYWSGDFDPAPVQRPRIPIWVAGEWPHRRPLRAGPALGRLFPDRAARS